MKLVKSLLLGSAAGLIAVGGAQAADLPVKAKAVEYVKICSLYGAGFYYIPGTDTCIKLGGYLRAEVALNTNSVYNGEFSGVAGAQNRYSNYFTMRSRQDLNIDTRTATEYGVVRTFFDATFSWTSGGYAGGTTATGTPYAGDGIAGGTLGVYYAFIQFAGFTMGKAVSQFDAPWTNYPGNNFDGLVGGGGTVTGVNQFTYTADFGQGVTASISAQDPTAYGTSNIWNTSYGAVSPSAVTVPASPATTFSSQYLPAFATGAYGVQSLGGSRAPDLIGMVRIDQAWGLFQASVAAHNNHASYYNIANETSGHPDDKWGWAGQLALSIKNIPTGAGDTINIQGAYAQGASRYVFQSLMPTTFAMYGGTGLAGAYQSVGFAGVSDAVFAGTSAATGTQLELTTSFGMRGAYTHNWDPYWNTALYGAWGGIRYNSNASAAICANFAGGGGFAAAPVAGSGFTCNPDFNLAQVGLITRWTPVKNLTFSADFNWTHLDQKYTGAVAIPTTSGSSIGKPTAVYELKDQDSLTLLLRAQRNW